MELNRIEEALEKCRDHLTKTNSFNTEIESYLTQYLLVLICATLEKEIKSIVIQRARNSNDTHLESFCRSCVSQLFRSIKTNQISGLLGRFGDDYKTAFSNKVNGTRAETFFNNIVSNRHQVAHDSGVNTTYEELEVFYREGVTVLDEFQKVISS